MNNGYIVGIDIGAYNIHGTIGRADKQGKLKILSSCSIKSCGIKKGMIISIDDVSESIRTCIAKLETLVNVYIDEIYVGIPSGLCNLISSSGVVVIDNDQGEVTYEDIKRVLKSSGNIKIARDEKIIDIIPEAYSIDDKSNVKNPLGMKGNKLEVITKVAVVDDGYISDIYKAAEKCSIRIVGTMVQGQAASTMILTEDDKSETIALVDVGGDCANIAIYSKEKLAYTSKIQIGGNSITNDIAYFTKLSLGDSEIIKTKIYESPIEDEVLQFTTSRGESIQLDKEKVKDVINARAEEILRLIIEKLRSTVYYDDINSIILYGGGLSNFAFINNMWKRINHKSLFIINSRTINLQNPLTINSIGIVKYVYNELKLNSEVIFYEDEIPLDDDENIYSEDGIIKRIKDYFRKYF